MGEKRAYKPQQSPAAVVRSGSRSMTRRKNLKEQMESCGVALYDSRDVFAGHRTMNWV
ncbi:MAG: hypothetical protein ACLR6B_14710 [Blautia sp.]